MPSRVTQKGKRQPASKPKKVSPTHLFDEAQAALEHEDYDTAKRCMREALKCDPNNIEYLDAYGSLLAEVGPEEEAIIVLKQAVQVSPDDGFGKYMYLSQLLEGQEGLDYCRKGVEILQRNLQAADTLSLPTKETKLQLCRALCSLAELLMSTGDDVASVAEEVEEALSRAQGAAPTSPEPLQAKASLRYEQGNPEEALSFLRQSMVLWRGKHEGKGSDDEADSADEDASESMDDDDDLDLGHPQKYGPMEEDEDDQSEDEGPGYEFRFECAKLLLELDENTDTAIEVLEDLLEEDDQVLDVWHLLGLAYYSGGMLEEAEEVIQKAAAIMKAQKVKKDDEIVAQFAELHEALTESKAAVNGTGEGC